MVEQIFDSWSTSDWSSTELAESAELVKSLPNEQRLELWRRVATTEHRSEQMLKKVAKTFEAWRESIFEAATAILERR